MKISKKQILDIIGRVDIPGIAEGYNSMSSAGKSLANAAKRRFAKDYPDIDIGIDGRDGWITVNGEKAVNMSQASGSPLSLDDVVDKMKQVYLGHAVQEGAKMKITKRQLRRIIKEEKTKILNEDATGMALSDLYAVIDAMIAAMGNEGAHLELAGIVEDWDDSFGSEITGDKY